MGDDDFATVNAFIVLSILSHGALIDAASETAAGVVIVILQSVVIMRLSSSRQHSRRFSLGLPCNGESHFIEPVTSRHVIWRSYRQNGRLLHMPSLPCTVLLKGADFARKLA